MTDTADRSGRGPGKAGAAANDDQPPVQPRVEHRDGRPVVLLTSDDECPSCRRFLDRAVTRGLSSLTAAAYAYDLALAHRWLAASKLTLDQVTADHLHQFLAWERGRESHPKSINRRLHTFRQYYHFAVGRDLPGGVEARGAYRRQQRDRELGLQRLPRVGFRQLRVKEPRTLVEPLSVPQVRLLLASMRRYRDLCIAYAMLLCGLRTQEVLGLRRGDIDVEDGRVRVFGKGQKERVVPLPTLLVRLLGRYQALERPQHCPTDHAFVVLQGHRRGQAMTRDALRRIFRTQRAAAPDLANANPDRLRHTFGTDMARSGVRLPILQKMLGHAFPETTLQYVNLSLADVAAESAPPRHENAGAAIRARRRWRRARAVKRYGHPLPPFAETYIKKEGRCKSERVVVSLHRWLRRHGKEIAAITGADLQSFAACPARRPVTQMTRNDYRYAARRYLRWHEERGLAGPFGQRELEGYHRRPLPAEVQRFLRFLAPIRRASTIKTYLGFLRRFHEWLATRSTKIAEVDRAVCLESSQQINDEGIAAATRVGMLVCVRKYIDWLWDFGLVSAPGQVLIKGPDLPKKPDYLPRPLPPEADQLLQSRFKDEKSPIALGLLVMRRAGLRLGELRRLEHDCVRDDHAGGRFLKVPLGKLNNERLVPLDPKTLEAVRVQDV